MRKTIYTIDDLYKFCLKNKFDKFNSDDSNANLIVRVCGTFTKEDTQTNRDTEGLIPFVSKAFHDHVNLNKSNIDTKTFNDNLGSTHLRPILAHIVKNEETGELEFGSHDFYIEEDEDGNSKTIYEEQPVGVIDGNKTEIEFDEQAGVNRAIVHGYLYEGYCQDAIDILTRRGSADCSVELCIREMSFNAKEKILNIDDFYVSGLTILSAKVAPGMKGSHIKLEDFSVKTFSLDEKLIDTLDKLNETLSRFNINADNAKRLEEGGNKSMFEELLQQYHKTLEDITFEYENLSDEDLKTAFETAFASSTDGSDENHNQVPTTAEDTNDENTNNFNDSSNLEDQKFTKVFELSHDDIRCALYALLANVENIDNDCYFIENVYDNHFVYSNWNGTKTFGQNYSKDGDNINLNGERYELYKELLTVSEKAELESMRANYSELIEAKEKLAKYEAEPDKMALLNSEDYMQIAETDEFKTLAKQENHFDLSFEEIRAQADNMLLAYAKHNKIKFAATKPEDKKPSFAFARVEHNSNFLDGLLKK